MSCRNCILSECPCECPHEGNDAPKRESEEKIDWQAEAAEILTAVVYMLENEGMGLDEVPAIHIHNLYLVASYLYYNCAHSMMQDATFDRICRWLLDHFDELFYFIWWPERTLNKEALEAGTGFDIDFPEQIILIAKRIKPQ